MLLIFMAVLYSMSGCDQAQSDFDGSQISDERQFILEFDLLNTTLSHEMVLEENDIVEVVIIRKGGELNILVSDPEGQPIYRADDASSGKFALEMTKSGSYMFRVTGDHASGKVSFILRDGFGI